MRLAASSMRAAAERHAEAGRWDAACRCLSMAVELLERGGALEAAATTARELAAAADRWADAIDVKRDVAN